MLTNQLEEFSQLTQEEINSYYQQMKFDSKQNTQRIQELKQELFQIITQISKNGEISYEWKQIKNFILISLKDILQQVQKKYPDCKNDGDESFDEQLEIILQYLSIFEEKAPFTLQRICELIIDPYQNYKSSKKFIFAIQKLVNISPQ